MGFIFYLTKKGLKVTDFSEFFREDPGEIFFQIFFLDFGFQFFPKFHKNFKKYDFFLILGSGGSFGQKPLSPRGITGRGGGW